MIEDLKKGKHNIQLPIKITDWTNRRQNELRATEKLTKKEAEENFWIN